MSANLSAIFPAPRTRWSFGLSPVLLAVAGLLSLGSAGCENKAVGRLCELQSDPNLPPNQAIINDQALECPSRLCLRPALDPSVGTSMNTTATCTAECSSDDDCDGETGDETDPNDHRCKGGFVCTVATVVGPLCCKRMCVCRDFLDVEMGSATPRACMKSEETTCVNVK